MSVCTAFSGATNQNVSRPALPRNHQVSSTSSRCATTEERARGRCKAEWNVHELGGAPLAERPAVRNPKMKTSCALMLRLIPTHHGTDKRSTTSRRASTREHSSQRSLSGSMVSWYRISNTSRTRRRYLAHVMHTSVYLPDCKRSKLEGRRHPND